MKPKNLTLKQITKLRESLYTIKTDDFVIKWYQYPFLWFLYMFIGKKWESEGFTFYIVDFRGVRYVLKSTDPK